MLMIYLLNYVQSPFRYLDFVDDRFPLGNGAARLFRQVEHPAKGIDEAKNGVRQCGGSTVAPGHEVLETDEDIVDYPVRQDESGERAEERCGKYRADEGSESDEHEDSDAYCGNQYSRSST
jgi:hypothetical protein